MYITHAYNVYTYIEYIHNTCILIDTRNKTLWRFSRTHFSNVYTNLYVYINLYNKINPRKQILFSASKSRRRGDSDKIISVSLQIETNFVVCWQFSFWLWSIRNSFHLFIMNNRIYTYIYIYIHCIYTYIYILYTYS